jgi:hypothetical protein
MRDKEILGLYDAYLQVHTYQEEVEQLDEAREASHDPEGYEERQRRSQSSRQRRMNDPHTGINSPAFHAFMAKQMGGKKKKDTSEQVEVDLFDYILEHLIAEGYADTNEAAIAIMANMSEEWREEIVEGAAGDVADRAAKLARQKKGQTPERKAMYQSLAQKAAARERGPYQRGDARKGLTSSERTGRRESDAYQHDVHGSRSGTHQHGEPTYGKGGVTRNPRKLAQQKARGQHG